MKDLNPAEMDKKKDQREKIKKKYELSRPRAIPKREGNGSGD